MGPLFTLFEVEAVGNSVQILLFRIWIHTLGMKDVMVFATTYDSPPPLGFKDQPTIKFIHREERTLATASVCSCTVNLLTAPCDYPVNTVIVASSVVYLFPLHM